MSSQTHRNRHRTEEPEGESSGGMERWLLTYSDMITLLLALFIVLFALSTINLKKFEAFKSGVVTAFSHHAHPLTKGGTGLLNQTSLVTHPGTVVAPAASQGATPATPATQSAPGQPIAAPLPQIGAQISAALSSQGLATNASITTERRGLVIRVLADKAFYATDSATLGSTGARVVDTIASVLARYTNNVAVEGYTDNQPILGGPYSSNWQLSAMRAVNVLLRLVRTDHLAYGRFSAIGYASNHPLAPNTTPANQALNRRVDVVVLAPGKTRI